MAKPFCQHELAADYGGVFPGLASCLNAFIPYLTQEWTAVHALQAHINLTCRPGFFVGLFVLSCWTYRNPLAMAGCRSSAPPDSKAQVQLISSSLAQSRCPCLRCLWSTEWSQLRHILWTHHIPAHLQHSKEIQLAQSVGSGLSAAQAGSQHCLSETRIQSCLFRNCCRQENPAPWNTETLIIY